MNFHKDWILEYQQNELLFSNFLKFYLTKEFDLNDNVVERLIFNHSTLKGIYDNIENLRELQNLEGKKLFSRYAPQTIEKIKLAIKKLEKSKSIEELYYNSIARFFIQRQIENINSLKLEEITPNPFLIRSLNITSVEDLIEFIVQSRITRSIVTSFGYVFEDILIASGCEKLNSGFDVKKVINGIETFIQCKSGTNDMDKDQIIYWKGEIESHSKRYPKNRYYIGMPYGKRNSSTVTINLLKQYFNDGFDNHTLIGKELWDTLHQTKDFHLQILNYIESGLKPVIENESVMMLIKKKIKVIEEEFISLYGNDAGSINKYMANLF